MPAADVNGITIEYDERGSGEPLLLVMGLSGQLVAWPDDFVDRLVAQGFRVIRFDNRDIGLSTKVDAPPPSRGRVVLGTLFRRFARSSYLLADMADDAVGLLDHLGIDRAHVVGVSMGGMISQSIAIGHPERVASLTSIMSNTGDRKHGKPKTSLLLELARNAVRADADPVEAGVASARLIAGAHFNADAERVLVETALARFADGDGILRQTMAIAASPDRTPQLRQLNVPTLVVHGLDDRLVQPSGGVATAKAIPGARLVMYPQMAHDLPRVRWDELVDEIVQNTKRATTPAADVLSAGARP